MSTLSFVMTLALAFWCLGWTDRFHLATGAAFLAALVPLILAFRRRSSPPLRDRAASADEYITPARGGAMKKALGGLGWTILALPLLFGFQCLMERTPLYDGYRDRDRPALEARLATLESAGNTREASRLIDQRLQSPLSSAWKRALQARLVDDLTRSATASGSLDDQIALLSRAISIAREAQQDARLAQELLARAQERRAAEVQLEQLRSEGRWDETIRLLDSLLARPEQGVDRPRLAAALVEALTESGKEQPQADAQAARYRRAVEVARKYGLPAGPAETLLALAESSQQNAATFINRLDSLRSEGRWSEVVSILRGALATGISSPGHDLQRDLIDALANLAASQNDPAARLQSLEEALQLATSLGIETAQLTARLEAARATLADQESLARHIDSLRLQGDFAALVDLLTPRLASPRDQWGLPLDRILVEAYLGWADHEPEPEVRLALCQKALEAAQKYSIETAPIESRIELLQTALADRRRQEAERLRPVSLPTGARAGVLRVSTDSWPVLTVDTWVETDSGEPVENLQPKDFQLSLNGRPVSQLDLAPLVREATRLSLVVALDISASTAGAALDSARQGLAALLAGLERYPEIEVRLIAFNDRLVDVAPWSSDHRGILHHAKALAAAGNTALLQAVDFGVKELLNRPGERCLVIFSDGAGTVPAPGLTLADLGSRCQKSGVIVHSIGLATPGQDLQTLKLLAGQTGGLYLEADSVASLVSQFRRASGQIHPRFYRLVARAEAGSPAHPLEIDLRIGDPAGRHLRLATTPDPASLASQP